MDTGGCVADLELMKTIAPNDELPSEKEEEEEAPSCPKTISVEA